MSKHFAPPAPPLAVAVVGLKDTGKTTLCLELAKALQAKGRKVAMAKFSASGFDEPAQTDTAQFKTVAQAVLGLSEKESFVSWPHGPQGRIPLQWLAPLAMGGPYRADLLLVEGGKELGMLPRIVLADTAEDTEALSAGLAMAVLPTRPDASRSDIPGADELADLVLERGFLLPGLDCSACGREDCAGLARDIVAGKAAPEDCVTRQAGMSITVDGRSLDLNPFVERILAAGLRGMLGELKGFGPGRIEISLDDQA